MRDLALLLILLALCGMALARPWLGVLGLAVLAFMHPQGYGQEGMREAPVFLLQFGAVVVGAIIEYARARRLPVLAPDWRLFLILGLWLWFLVTSYHALVPWAAWAKYREVLKILPSLLLLLILIDTREKLFILLATLALSILLAAVKGGYWAVMTGFHDRVYGPPGSPYYENNAFAVMVAMTIPLLVLWLWESRARSARLFLLAGIVLCYGAVLSSWSRAGLLTLVVVTLLLFLVSRRKLLLLPLLVLGGTLFFLQLPETWFGRMETLRAVHEDASARGRLSAWNTGLEYALRHPVTGTGFDSWPALTYADANLDWHSIYVEMVVEHGFVGLALWVGLLFGTLLHLAWLARAGRRAGLPWLHHQAALLGTSLAAYAVGGISLGITYWEQLYVLIVASVILTRLGDAALRAPPTAKMQTSEKITLAHGISRVPKTSD